MQTIDPDDGIASLSSMPGIDVFIGTKAQYIKTAPLLRLLQARQVPFRLIDSGQHAGFAPGLRKELGVREPDLILASGGNIKSVFEAALWFTRYFLLTIFRPAKIRREIFAQPGGYCVVHGDTPTTLLSVLMAGRARKKIVLLEAGLRSSRLLRPFPEELIRRFCMRRAAVLFAPSEWAMSNLASMKLKGTSINIGQNTNVEALHHALARLGPEPARDQPYCLFTVHRVETILKKSRLQQVLAFAGQAAERCRVVFVMHDPTRRKLRDFGLMASLERLGNMEITGLLPHDKFIHLVRDAEFVLTDGGSIQEECHYLDKPCLLLRSETERREGLGENVVLCNFEADTVTRFVDNPARFRSGRSVENREPSRVVLDYLLGH